MALLKEWVFIDGIGLAWDVILVNDDGVFIKERNVSIMKLIQICVLFLIFLLQK